MNESGYLIQDDCITIIHKGKTYTITDDNENFNTIIDLLENEQNYEEAISLIDIAGKIQNFFHSVDSNDKLLTINNYEISYNGHPLNNSLTKRILKMINENRSANPLINFLKNLLDNPSNRAINETYRFLEANNLPITTDGYLLAYKRVTPEFKDYYTKTISNKIGEIVIMKRNQVDDNKDQTCSNGLHFCSLNYLQDSGYGGSGPIVILKINPADIVSIPTDYNNSKGRCCKYEVVGIHKESVNNDILSQQTIIDDDEYGEFWITTHER